MSLLNFKLISFFFCKLMSTDLLQRGRDLDGIDGFLISDIQNILNATKNVKCTYCHKPNATARCNAPDCYKIFHYPCGLRNHALSEFCNSFHSYCDVHNLNRGRNLRRYIALSNIPPNCIYCHEVIRAEHDYYVTECCRVCVMHTRCLKVCVQLLLFASLCFIVFFYNFLATCFVLRVLY